jgi:hypothetical protein
MRLPTLLHHFLGHNLAKPKVILSIFHVVTRLQHWRRRALELPNQSSYLDNFVQLLQFVSTIPFAATNYHQKNPYQDKIVEPIIQLCFLLLYHSHAIVFVCLFVLGF